jgi:hypothetical protein
MKFIPTSNAFVEVYEVVLWIKYEARHTDSSINLSDCNGH